MRKIELEYAIAKQLKAARDHMTIQTSYGAFDLDGHDACAIADIIECIFEARLKNGEYEYEFGQITDGDR